MTAVLRIILGALAVVVGLATAGGCAPAAVPAPTPTAVQPTAGAVKPSSPSEAGTDWKAKWDETVAAARKEGKVVLAGATGERFRDAAMEFEKAYPGIRVEYSGTPAGEKMAKIKAERQGGQYLWDVFTGGWTTVAGEYTAFLTPLRPQLILPEVLDDSKWLSGFDAGLIEDRTFSFFAYMFFGAYVNRELYPQGELKEIADLLDPKYKGKIAWGDPRVPGAGRSIAAHLLAERGEPWYRKLLAQDIVATTDMRKMAEDLVRGRYAVAFGVRAEDITTLMEAKLWDHVEPLAGAAYSTSGSGHVAIFDKAPNPNAAKVFVNWLLTKEAQDIHVKLVDVNSRRLDAIDGPADTAVPQGYKFTDNQFLEWPYNDAVVNITKDVLK